MRSVEAIMIALIMALSSSMLIKAKLGYENSELACRLSNTELILAWLDAQGYLKPWIYSRNYRALRETISQIIEAPFELIVYDHEGRILMIVKHGDGCRYSSYQYFLTGVNGSMNIRIIVLRVAVDEQ